MKHAATGLGLCLLAGLAPAGAQDAVPAWTPVWAEEFEGEAIDRTRWRFDIDCWGGGNNERQCYTDREANARIVDGELHIIARRERARGPAEPMDWHPDGQVDSVTRPFTSARLTTRGLAGWTYGRIEVRAMLPEGQGVWPAIWMLPEDRAYGGWAASGEIDIMEAVNLGTRCADCPGGVENRVHGTLHYGGEWPENAYSGSAVALEDPAGRFHTFAVEWGEGEIRWFVDGELYASQTSQTWYTAGEAPDRPHAPFDRKFHLLLNLAVGGNWPEGQNEGGVSEDGFPRTFRIDWVRVHACGVPGADARPCFSGGE